MAKWAAANVRAPSPRKRGGRSGAHESLSRPSETVEAALARLTNAYSTAMNCVTSLSRIPADTSVDVSTRLALAARSTFEQAILLDPLVVDYSSTWNELFRKNRSETPTQRAPPPRLSSSSHRSTVRELAHISLVNYADLLVRVLDQSNDASWTDEARGLTWRFVLVSYCDAVEVDGSDPTVWLKLARAAQKLDPVRYRRLERHALEKGRVALPPQIPPNRSVLRALEKHQHAPPVYASEVFRTHETESIVIDVPRYSWSVLGRLLLRACRDGSTFKAQHHLDYHPFGPHMSTRTAFGSPRLVLKLSPMLTLPLVALGVVCEFLDNSSIWRFEATCRTLSSSILSARASLEMTRSLVGRESEASKPGPATDLESSAPADAKDLPKPAFVPTRDEPESNAVQSQRASKRVRSQLITSGKIAERKAKRGSVRFCLVAAVLGCDPTDERLKLLWDDKHQFERLTPETLMIRRVPLSTRPTSIRHDDVAGESQRRLGSASMNTFIQGCVSNSGPFDVVSQYLFHVSWHVEDIVASDPDGVQVLVSIVMECMEVQRTRSGTWSAEGISPLLQGPRPRPSLADIRLCLKTFAVNLLHAELRLRRCDRLAREDFGFDGDSNVLSVKVPELLQYMEDIDGSRLASENRSWMHLKIRCLWLACGFYIWWKRSSNNDSDKIKASRLALQYLDEALRSLQQPPDDPIISVRTRHLASPGRPGTLYDAISDSTLNRFREEILASSVISSTRDRFFVLVSRIEKRIISDGSEFVTDDERKRLAEIGDSLIQRYSLPYQVSGARQEELFDDFVSNFGQLLDKDAPNDVPPEEKWNALWHLFSSGPIDVDMLQATASPSILPLLVICIQARNESRQTIIILLTRIILSGFGQQTLILGRLLSLSRRNLCSPGAKFGSTDDGDDSLSSDGDIEAVSDGDASDKGKQDHSLLQLNGRAIQFLSEKVAQILRECCTDDERSAYLASEDCVALIQISNGFYSDLCHYFTSMVPDLSSPLDMNMFLSSQTIVDVLLQLNPEVETGPSFESVFLETSGRILITQARGLVSILRPGGNLKLGRSARQKLCIQRAGFFGALAATMANLLSKRPASSNADHLSPSNVVPDDRSENITSTAFLPLLLQSVLGLWSYIEDVESGRNATSAGGSTFDRPIMQELAVPVAAMIVSICGSACTTDRWLLPVLGDRWNDPLSLTEFYDTDSSANDWVMSTDGQAPNMLRRELLRVVCQAVQCISAVYRGVNEKLILSFEPVVECDQEHGFLLPLVTSRVLNFFAETVLVECSVNLAVTRPREKLWVTSWPFGARTIGKQIDAVLHTVYKILHGVSLDPSGGGTSVEDPSLVRYAPESVFAAVRLYRCVMRTYGNGKRSPPKSSLECIDAALPALEEDERSRILRRFLFDSSEGYLSVEDVVHDFSKNVSLGKIIAIPEWIWETKDAEVSDVSSETSDILLVRKGICHELAQGPLPAFSTGTLEHLRGFKTDDQREEAEQRLHAARNEFELGKKFDAIFEDLCYGELSNSEGWYNAAQCLAMKAEVVADRVGLSKGFSRGLHFHARIERNFLPSTLPINHLISSQEKESVRGREGWIPFLGDDLSVFIQYSWSSFASLEECARQVGKGCAETQSDYLKDDYILQRFRVQVWHDIQELHRKGNYAAWQQAWGGIFISALRILATRCRCIALFLSRRLRTLESATVTSEISESQALAYYMELVGSQTYGYPMHEMADLNKRKLASASKSCFQLSLDTLAKDDDSDARVTWDLHFMVGKCYEKMAATYNRESFTGEVDRIEDDHDPHQRVYEGLLREALSHYAQSLEEALTIEQDGGLSDIHGGGSTHGSMEVFYRLHASRLKCLIRAVIQTENDRELAEREALRLTTVHWYRNENKIEYTNESNVRDTVWAVLADIVAALVQCRLEQPFFHRSVYRHAQALMWAPVLHDPTATLVEASTGVVPATKSHLLRGLNSSTPCTNSAEVVMRTLFEKKRAQLCAVWVTNSGVAQSPFEVINNSIRKYDSLRGKYLYAYIDTLRLCRRTSQLETLLQWTVTTKRDLPAFFYASAERKGEPPDVHHIRESLLFKGRSLVSTCFLRTVKRQANSALADIILHQLSSSSDTKVDRFKMAYSCFLRLNCSVDELERIRAWKSGRRTISEVEALCRTYLTRPDHETVVADASDWSGGSQKSAVLKAAIDKGKELYPALDNQSRLYGKRKTTSKKNVEQNPPNTDQATSKDEPGGLRKRTEPDRVNKSFIVSVPQGLHAGDKFTTSVTFSEGVKKTIKITVPAGSPSKISFSLEIPRQGDNRSPQLKRRKADKGNE